jgi:hypothetical protein
MQCSQVACFNEQGICTGKKMTSTIIIETLCWRNKKVLVTTVTTDNHSSGKDGSLVHLSAYADCSFCAGSLEVGECH